MPNNTGVLLIYNGPDRTNINLVGAALGRGPESFTKKLTDEDPAAWNSTVSAWFAFEAGSLALMDKWGGMTENLPTINDQGFPIVWEDFGLTEVSAAAAVALLTVIAVDTPDELTTFISDVVGGVTYDKRVVPDPPL